MWLENRSNEFQKLNLYQLETHWCHAQFDCRLLYEWQRDFPLWASHKLNQIHTYLMQQAKSAHADVVHIIRSLSIRFVQQFGAFSPVSFFFFYIRLITGDQSTRLRSQDKQQDRLNSQQLPLDRLRVWLWLMRSRTKNGESLSKSVSFGGKKKFE